MKLAHQHVNFSIEEQSDDDVSTVITTESNKRKRFSNFLQVLQEQKNDEQTRGELNMNRREELLDQSDDPTQYWEINKLMYPVPSQLASHYLSFPASSAPVEKLFRVVGNIIRPDRCRMKECL